MKELRICATSTMNSGGSNSRATVVSLFNPLRWHISVDGGSTPVIQRPARVHTYLLGPGAGSTLELIAPDRFVIPLEENIDDEALLHIDLLQLGHPFWNIRNNVSIVDRVVLDLQEVSYINPMGLMSIVFLCETLYDIYGRKVDLFLPSYNSGTLASVCTRSPNFLEAISDTASLVGEYHAPLKEQSFDVIPVTRINSPDDVFRLIPHLERSEHIRAEAFVNIASELCQNIYQHSRPGGDPHGYVAMQAYGSILQLAVMDSGVGIPTTLQNKYHFEEDVDALSLACSQQIPRDNKKPGLEADRGHGLPRTLETVIHNYGYMDICSGNARIIFGPDRPGGRHYACANEGVMSTPFPGTYVGILMPIPSREEESKI